jgi:prefoldin subunit 5
MISSNKSITIALALVAIAAIGISGISTAANAKESTCDVTAGGKCLIIAKRGDVEIDKLTIVVGSGGGVATNLTDINNAISVIQGQIASQSDQIGTVNSQLNTLSAQVANFSDTGITSIELQPVNETVPAPVENTTDTGNVTDTNSTG